MKRRSFLGLVAAMPATAAAPIDVAAIKSRGTKKVEIVYKSPHTTPNGLQATRDGMWVADDRTVDGKNWISLVNYSDGKVIREFQVARPEQPQRDDGGRAGHPLDQLDAQRQRLDFQLQCRGRQDPGQVQLPGLGHRLSSEG